VEGSSKRDGKSLATAKDRAHCPPPFTLADARRSVALECTSLTAPPPTQTGSPRCASWR